MSSKAGRYGWLMYVAIVLILVIPLACAFGPVTVTNQNGGNNPGNGSNQNNNPLGNLFQVATDTPEANTGNIPNTGNSGSSGNSGSPNSTGNRGPVDIGNLASAPSKAPENLAELYNQVNPGAVSIDVQINQGGQTGEAAGSGFIITDTGYIATNNHVVQGAQQVYVTFFNQTISKAQVVGVDPNSDLAILKVDKLPKETHPLPMGDSSKINVGDYVVAIGNPFALGTSMSYGIISALGRVIPSLTDYTIPQAIQTDAAINPGNSGGPLINMNGEVIGIDAQIQTGSSGGGNVGVGFAIPINILKLVYQSLIQKGSYTWPYMGVAGGPITPQAAQQLGVDMNQRGAFIAQVTSGGPAAKAGLRANDIITQVDGQNIGTFDDLLSYVAFKKPGDKVNLTVQRGGNTQQLTVTLGERPQTTSNPNNQ